MADWRVAHALIKLREQVNEKFPNRSKAADGTIGDAAHASRSSDHNPWVKLGGMGIVTGMDITHDPLHGLDSEYLAEALRNNRDIRLKYIISNKKIASFDHGNFMWREYHGKNAHNHHCHISVKPESGFFDSVLSWDLEQVRAPSKAPMEKPHTEPRPLLKIGSMGDLVKELQTKLGIEPVDGVFGPQTVEAVKQFQQAQGLTPDGKVGPYTWEKF